MLDCRQCHNKHISGKKKRKRNGAANHQLIRMMNSFPPPPKNKNRLSEKLAWITSMSKPSRKSKTTNPLSSIVKTKSSPYLTQNRTGQQTAYTKTDTVEPTNGDPSITDELNPKVDTSPTRLFKDTPNPDRTSDGFLKPITPKRKGAKSSKDPIKPVIPTTVIDTNEAEKLKADLEAEEVSS